MTWHDLVLSRWKSPIRKIHKTLINTYVQSVIESVIFPVHSFQVRVVKAQRRKGQRRPARKEGTHQRVEQEGAIKHGSIALVGHPTLKFGAGWNHCNAVHLL